MQTHDTLDGMTLNAYVDGQLDTHTERTVLHAMETDARIREQVHRLRRAKDWMRSGFADAEPPTYKSTGRAGFTTRVNAGIAAAFMALAVGLSSGLTGYLIGERENAPLAQGEDPNRVLLHLDESEPETFAALLDYAEYLLKDSSNSNVQVEVIANAGGVDLMRVGESPYEARIRALSERYDNLHFIACANAIRHLQATGVEAVLIDEVHSGDTAVDHIVARLRDGWTYKKVTGLPGI